jgi:hypothetical protein
MFIWTSTEPPESATIVGVPERDVRAPHEPELYNIAEDPGEEHNMAGRHPGRVRKMLCQLETWFEEVEHERATIDDRW